MKVGQCPAATPRRRRGRCAVIPAPIYPWPDCKAWMDRAAVAAYYRGKGYLVHDNIVVTGQSGNQQRVPLLCEGPLGNLAVFFGDAGGIDGHEIGAAKRVARDLGATAVVAAGSFTSAQRRTAADLGVVLVDAALLEENAPAPRPASTWPGATPKDVLDLDLSAHPWPASGRPGGKDTAPVQLIDIDFVQGHRDPRPAPPTTAAASEPAPARTRSSDGGLWTKTAAAPAPSAPAAMARSSPPSPARAPGAQAFAWLVLPPAPAGEPEIEVRAGLQARAAPAPLTPAQLEEQRVARLARQARLRQWTRRGAWLLGAGVLVYLFLLWWF